MARKAIYFKGRIETLVNRIAFYTALGRTQEAAAIRKLARDMGVSISEDEVFIAVELYVSQAKQLGENNAM